MRVLRFAAEVGRSIQAFGSVEFRLAPLARLTSGARIACARLGAGGRIGRHPAASAQLLLVVEGEGRVRGETGDEVPIRAGEAAFWAKGEQHETSTTGGLTAILIEAESLDPDVFAFAGSLTADSQR
jgi:quercetin dioxygenase-like cupin family protein